LKFNPHFRTPAAALLQHDCFLPHKMRRQEKEAKYRIKLRVDKPGNFDYMEFKSVFSQRKYLRLLQYEISKIGMLRGG